MRLRAQYSATVLLVGMVGSVVMVTGSAAAGDPSPGIASERGTAYSEPRQGLNPGPQVSGEVLPASPAPTAEPQQGKGAPLGALGFDERGRPGRVHVVIPGDTLWDISNAYLGSAWVWPSIWKDNGDIANPHLIYPNDHIWITPTEMRRISSDEAEAFLAASPAPVEDEEPEPVAEPAPIAIDEPTYVRVASREAADLVSPEQLEAAASVVDAVSERQMLSQGDEVYIGLGGQETHPSEQFTVFRKNERVFDPDTGKVLGYHVDVLGWVEVQQTDRETSLARIWRSYAPIERGDRLMPREPLVLDVALRPSPDNVDGKLSFFTDRRTMMSHVDFVSLNRGTKDGLQVGSPLEVYRQEFNALETVRGEDVLIPDRVVAQLLVVRAGERSSVAWVANTQVELKIGDRFRGASDMASIAAR